MYNAKVAKTTGLKFPFAIKIPPATIIVIYNKP